MFVKLRKFVRATRILIARMLRRARNDDPLYAQAAFDRVLRVRYLLTIAAAVGTATWLLWHPHL